MSKTMIFKEEVFFKANPDQVWDLLINPAMTRQYMFGCEVVSNWEIGGPLNWKGTTEDGTEVIYVKGNLLEYEKGKKISSTTFDPNGSMEDIPENYVNLSYEISPQGTGTLLTIQQGDFSKAANGQQRYEESKAGWVGMVIPTMKQLLGE